MDAKVAQACRKELAQLAKQGALKSELRPHQQRVVEKLREQPGLVVAHGLGSGKTLTSIAAHDDQKKPALVVVPAALQENYLKERDKHLQEGTGSPMELQTLQALARSGLEREVPMLIVDEAHRGRNSGTSTQEGLRNIRADKRMMLTASPFYNSPGDIAPLVNLVAGERVLPNSSGDFEKKYVAEKKVGPGLIRRLMGVKPGVVRELNQKEAPDLKKVLQKWVDYHENSRENFPTVEREVIEVPMTSAQLRTYDALLGQAPAWAAYKIKKGLPPSKAESKQLNAFSVAARQVSLSTRAHQPKLSPQEPKAQVAFERMQQSLNENPQHKGIVYSNYLDTGIAPYRERLEQAKIPFGEFTGSMKKKERDQLVKDFNEDKIRVLLLSSAGGEGLDLKGTRTIQVLEPHWNNEKLRQVEGRGIRYKSHDHLPEKDRTVKVEYYQATRPASGLAEKLRLQKPGLGIDQYMHARAEEKDRLIEDFKRLLRVEPKSSD